MQGPENEGTGAWKQVPRFWQHRILGKSSRYLVAGGVAIVWTLITLGKQQQRSAAATHPVSILVQPSSDLRLTAEYKACVGKKHS